jgi:hypothetical protein
MKALADVQRQLAAGEFDFSRLAFLRAVERNISEQEISEAGAGAEMIEDYPTDKYSRSACCLVSLRLGARYISRYPMLIRP